MSGFFNQYSVELVVAVCCMGFFPGLFLGYLFWGVYKDRVTAVDREAFAVSNEIAQLRLVNERLESQISRAK